MSAGVKVHRPPLNRAYSENIDDYKGDSPRKARPKLKRSLSANVRLSIEEKRRKVNWVLLNNNGRFTGSYC